MSTTTYLDIVETLYRIRLALRRLDKNSHSGHGSSYCPVTSQYCCHSEVKIADLHQSHAKDSNGCEFVLNRHMEFADLFGQQ